MVDDVVRSRATDASRPDRFARPKGRRAYAQRERLWCVCVCVYALGLPLHIDYWEGDGWVGSFSILLCR